MYFAESLTCDNTDICETATAAVMVIAIGSLILYLFVIALTLYLYRKSKSFHKLTPNNAWAWRLWFVVLAIPGIIWLSSLVLS